MKNRIIRMFTVICAAVFMACAVSVWAFAEDIPATSTDLPAAEEQGNPEIPGEETQPGEQEEQKEPVEPEEVPAEAQPETHELVPEEKPEEIPAEDQAEQPEDNQEGPAEGEEIIITKKLLVGQSWSGKVSKKKPAILKLDVSRSQSVHILVEGKNVWVAVEKTDRLTENPPRTETDPETKRTVISWSAQAGSYLITVGPVEPNPMAKATVTIMDDKAFEAWEAKQAEEEPETAEEAVSEEEPAQEEAPEPEEETEPVEESKTDIEPEEETELTEETESEPEEEQPEEETEPEEESKMDIEPEEEAEPIEEIESEPEEEQAEEETEPEEEAGSEPEEEAGSEPEEEQSEENRTESEIEPERHITVDVTWDVPDPAIGDTAHFKANLEGYDGLEYSTQWQYSPDRKTWYDIPDETSLTMDVIVTEENNIVYWRILVYVEDDQEI